MIKNVIFDFNGTLFWDTEFHNEAWDIFLEKHNIHLTYREKRDHIHGKNNKEILKNIFPRMLSEKEIEELSIEKEMIYQGLCVQTDMKLAQGAVEFLDFLINKKIPYTIATASELINVEFYFKHLDLGSYFEYSKLVYNDGKTLSKPNPQIFLTAIEVLGANGNETLIFEDSVSGILAAERAEVGKIIIVDSNNDDYNRWEYQKIRNFSEVNRSLFDSNLS